MPVEFSDGGPVEPPVYPGRFSNDLPVNDLPEYHSQTKEPWEMVEENEEDYDFEAEMLQRLENIQTVQTEHTKTLLALREGVNTIGEMMNQIADAFGQIMAQVQKGGLASLLGNVMGGKKNG